MKSLLLAFGLFFIVLEAKAYPNLVRKGYTSCFNCHMNQQGGGSLNSYGKYVAKESLGMFNDYDSAMGFLTPPKGEDADPNDKSEYVIAFLGRWAEVKAETHVGTFEKKISMQSDIEAAFKSKDDWTALFTVGQRLDSRDKSKNESADDLFMRRFYVGKHTQDYSARLGKFFPDFGINHPNHNLRTRGGVYFGPNQEPLTIQGTYFTKYLDVSAAAIKGDIGTNLENSSGFASNFAFRYQSNMIGFSYMDTKNDTNGSGDNAMNLYGMTGYMGKGYTLGEFIEKKKIVGDGRINSKRLGYVESGWEVYKGFVPYVNFQYEMDYAKESYFRDTGFGFQFMPYTHFEFTLQYFSNEFPGGAARTTYGTLNIYY